MDLKATIEQCVQDGIAVEAKCHWQMFGMENIAEFGYAKEPHEINMLFRKVARRFAPDKKKSRQWTEEEERKATEIYRNLIEAREIVLVEINKLPERYKRFDPQGEDMTISKWQ